MRISQQKSFCLYILCHRYSFFFLSIFANIGKMQQKIDKLTKKKYKKKNRKYRNKTDKQQQTKTEKMIKIKI